LGKKTTPGKKKKKKYRDVERFGAGNEERRAEEGWWEKFRKVQVEGFRSNLVGTKGVKNSEGGRKEGRGREAEPVNGGQL